MLHPDRKRPARLQRWFLQLTAAAAIACALLAVSERVGAHEASRDVLQQQHWNRERSQSELQRLLEAEQQPVAFDMTGKRVITKPETLVDYPDVPIDTLRQKVDTHNRRARDYGWVGGFMLFLFSSTATARRAAQYGERLAERTSETNTSASIQLLGALGVSGQEPNPPARDTIPEFSPVPSVDQIDHRYVRRFDPTVYYSSEYSTEMDVFDSMMDSHRPTLAERMVGRIRDALASRRERIQRQLEASAPPDEFAVYRNAIEPIVLDAPGV